MRIRTLVLLAVLPIPVASEAQPARPANPLAPQVERLATELDPLVVAWRRDFHEHPELGNREVRTAKMIADELRKLGFEVTTGVAHTGVVGVLRGGKAPADRSWRCAPTWTRCRSPSRWTCRSSPRPRPSGTARRWA